MLKNKANENMIEGCRFEGQMKNIALLKADVGESVLFDPFFGFGQRAAGYINGYDISVGAVMGQCYGLRAGGEPASRTRLPAG